MIFYNRRKFVSKTGILSASTFLGFLTSTASAHNWEGIINTLPPYNPSIPNGNQDFWEGIRKAYDLSPHIINLNNGGVSPAPKIVQETMKNYYDFSNQAPSYNMWRILDQGREKIREQLSVLAGCQSEESALNRNASEGLETIIFGLTLKAGDEVVACKQDYPNVVHAWKQREIRDKIKINWVNLQLPSEDQQYLIDQYVGAFTQRTRVVNLTHVINWNGQIIPVGKIAEQARQRGIDILVDGAHSFGQLDFKISELNCDYYATSLHKWLNAPIGSGMLYVRKNKIKNIYPLFASDDPLKEDIRKFEHLGTRPFFIEEAIGKAIEFHSSLGIQRKENRLHFLKNYWMDQVKANAKLRLHTSLDPRWGCAIGLVSVQGKQPADLENYLFTHYNIHTTTIGWENMNGVRITPNVYTSTRDLDLLIEGILNFSKA
ncbi:MAG: hypothetical protein NVS9B7_19600 [Flavisolibacter sp.]